jgi:hypothetical protein
MPTRGGYERRENENGTRISGPWVGRKVKRYKRERKGKSGKERDSLPMYKAMHQLAMLD